MYCTYEDLILQISEESLAKPAGDEDGNIDLTRIENGIKKAQAEIDAYCRGLYKVPLANPPEIIRSIAVDIALYNIFSGTGFDFSSESTDKILFVRYEKAIDFLKMVAANKVPLEDSSGSGTDEDGNGVKTKNLQISSEKRIFGRSRMKGF